MSVVHPPLKGTVHLKMLSVLAKTETRSPHECAGFRSEFARASAHLRAKCAEDRIGNDVPAGILLKKVRWDLGRELPFLN